MNLTGRLGGRPALVPVPGWSFGQPIRPHAPYYVRRAAWKLARQRRSAHEVVAPWLFGTSVKLVLSSDLGRCVWVAGCFEPNEMYLLSKVLSPGAVFVDVGANIGLYSLAAARLVGEAGRVVAFEPSPRERATLFDNLARNRLARVVVDERALGAVENARAVLHLADDQHGGQNTLGSVVYDNVRLVADAEVEVTTLDSALSGHGLEEVRVIKIDVEGAEFAVLSGARETLGRLRPVLMLELQQESLLAQGSSAPEVVELLSGLGYDVYRYAHKGDEGLLRRLDDSETTVAQDVVAVPAESSELVVSL